MNPLEHLHALNMGVTPGRVDNAAVTLQRIVEGPRRPFMIFLTTCNLEPGQVAELDSITRREGWPPVTLFELSPVWRSVGWRWQSLLVCAGTGPHGGRWHLHNVDDDCSVPHTWFSEACAAAERHPDAIVCSWGYPAGAPVRSNAGNGPTVDRFVTVPVASSISLPMHRFDAAELESDPGWAIMGGSPHADDEIFFTYWAWKKKLQTILYAAERPKPVAPYATQPDALCVQGQQRRGRIAQWLSKTTGWPVPPVQDFAAPSRPPPPTTDPVLVCSFAPSSAAWAAENLQRCLGVECVPSSWPGIFRAPLPVFGDSIRDAYVVGYVEHPARAYARAQADGEDVTRYGPADWLEDWNAAAIAHGHAVAVRDLSPVSLEWLAFQTAPIGAARTVLQHDLTAPGPVHVSPDVERVTALAAFRAGYLTRAQYRALK